MNDYLLSGSNSGSDVREGRPDWKSKRCSHSYLHRELAQVIWRYWFESMAFTQEPGCDSTPQVCWHFTRTAECITARGALKEVCHPVLGFNVLWSNFNKGQLKIHCCAAENIKFWAPYIFQGAQFYSTHTPEYISVKLLTRGKMRTRSTLTHENYI